MALTVAGNGRRKLQLSTHDQLTAWRSTISQDLQHALKKHRPQSGRVGGSGDDGVPPPWDGAFTTKSLVGASGHRCHVQLPHDMMVNTMQSSSSQGLERLAKHCTSRQERDDETRAASHQRFQKHLKLQEHFEALQEAFEEASGRKLLYPRGWAEVEDDPTAHLRNIRHVMDGSHCGKLPWEAPGPSSRSTPALPSASSSPRATPASSMANRRSAAGPGVQRKVQICNQPDFKDVPAVPAKPARNPSILRAKSMPVGNLSPHANLWRYAGGPSAHFKRF
mmetsp:Transcript_105683/g.297258  ORF Transcript_105683/g.297258 Transcript_105683/m.297258 type:complete len:279 (-) Transcript_105683:101-937(-)